MTTARATVVVPKPIEQVWRFLADYRMCPLWRPNLVEATARGRGVGARLHERRTNGTLASGVVTAVEPPTRLEFDLESTHGTIALQSTDGSHTRVTLTLRPEGARGSSADPGLLGAVCDIERLGEALGLAELLDA